MFTNYMGKKNRYIACFFALAAILQVAIIAFSSVLQKNSQNTNNQSIISLHDFDCLYDADLTSPSFDFLAEIEESSENEDAKSLFFLPIKFSYGFINHANNLVSLITHSLQFYRCTAIFLFNSVFLI